MRGIFHSADHPTQELPSPASAGPTPATGCVPDPPSYAVGIVHHRSYADLERCLASVKAQSVSPSAVLVVDAAPDPELLEAARGRHPEVAFEGVMNRGYAAGANRLLERVAADRPEAGFVLLLNPDVELEPGFAENLLAAMGEAPEAAIGTGKLLRPGGRVIDSAGIRLPANRRPRDRGSEQPDRGQFDRREYVFGATGAAMMLRRTALADLAIDGEIFDEDFFLYHEDTDLSWRANLLGWRVLYEPAARGVHARGWRSDGRFDMPVAVRRHAFKNHYLQLIKNQPRAGLARTLPVVLVWELLRLGFALLRDQAVLPAYADAWRLAGRALRKRRVLQRRLGERGGLAAG